MKRTFLLLVPLILACGPHFYRAPPPLAKYVERIPSKSWSQLLEESQPKDDTPLGDLIAAVRKFLDERYPTLDRAARIAAIDTLLDRNRQGEFSISLANFLLEFREITESKLPGKLVLPYLHRRALELTAEKWGPSKPFRSNSETEAEYGLRLLEFRNKLKDDIEAFETRFAKVPDALKPYELIQRGGYLYRSNNWIHADAIFRAVIDSYPDHPRSEVARFMTGRCALGEAHRHKPTTPEEKATRRELLTVAHERFETYLKKHPDGRFTDDAHGWISSIFKDQDDIILAINHQLRRLEIQSTREVARPALIACSQLFTRLFATPNALRHASTEPYESALSPETCELLASQPLAARLFVYHALDPASQIHLPIYHQNTTGDRCTLDFLRRRILLPGAYAEACLRDLGTAIIQSEKDPGPTSLLILGWSATRSGDHPQALALFDRALATTSTDELLHARAIALTRLDLHTEAADAFENLFKAYPASPLTAPSKFDHAIALQRSGQAGEALLALLKLTRYTERSHDRFEDPKDTNPLYLHPEHEATQWLDTIAQFSPIDQLRATLARLPSGDPHARLLRAIIRSRSLCQGDFVTASEFLDDPENPPFEIPEWMRESGGRWRAHKSIILTQTGWDADISKLAEMTAKLEGASQSDPETARLHLQLGRRWKALRGRVTLPLHGIFTYANSEYEKIDQLRRANAHFLGIPNHQATAELDSRDELRHALRHFLAAAEFSTDPAIAAPALESANEALFRLAEFSPYAASRAAETGASQLSEKLVTRLHTDFPDRPETARALPYHFLPPDLLQPWMPGDYSPGNSDWRIAVAITPWGSEPRLSSEYQRKIDAVKRALASVKTADVSLEKTRTNIADARTAFTSLRSKIDTADHLILIDNLDDLHAAAHVPGIDIDLFREYATLRLARSAPPKIDARWKPLAPFLEFLDRIRPDKKDKRWPVRGRGDTIESWTEFLMKFPDSPKSEPASLRLIRLQVRAACPIPHSRAFHFPESPITPGYKHLKVSKPKTDFDHAFLTAAIASHRKKYPAGRYDADLAVLEAAIASRAKDYPTALAALDQVLSDRTHSELRQDASLYFAELAQRLLEPVERPALVPALRESENALTYLKNLAHGDTSLSRLRPLLPALAK